MKVELFNNPILPYDFYKKLSEDKLLQMTSGEVTSGQVISLAAIRECYSYKTAKEVIETEWDKYFGDKGKEGKRLFNQIVKSGHTSTLEHLQFSFGVEGISRACLAQLTRHRHMSFSVQSQRYVKFSSDSSSGGFEYVKPDKIENEGQIQEFEEAMHYAQKAYDLLIKLKVPQEEARSVLPNAAATNLMLSANLRSILEFYKKRKKGNGAQSEISELAERIKELVIEVEPWTEDFFE